MKGCSELHATAQEVQLFCNSVTLHAFMFCYAQFWYFEHDSVTAHFGNFMHNSDCSAMPYSLQCEMAMRAELSRLSMDCA